VNEHINAPAFAATCAEALLEMIATMKVAE